MSEYVEVRVDVRAVLDDWRGSLLAHHWLDNQGRILPVEALSDKAREDLRQARLADQNGGQAAPIIGLGMMDNIEICTGHARVMMLAARGDQEMIVRIRESQRPELQKVIIDD